MYGNAMVPRHRNVTPHVANRAQTRSKTLEVEEDILDAVSETAGIKHMKESTPEVMPFIFWTTLCAHCSACHSFLCSNSTSQTY
jgi:hypothetical protein